MVTKVGRERYIVERELQEEEKKVYRTVKERLLEFQEKRHIILQEKDLDTLNTTDMIHYTCEIHPDTIHCSQFSGLMNMIQMVT